jgi:AGCS family alanine or glycine:cation symporter
MMILAMGFPNILGLLILAPEVKKDLNVYWRQLKSGEIKKYK